MKASFDGFGRSLSSESTQANENNRDQLALEFSKLEDFVMRGSSGNNNNYNNNYQTGEDRNSTHADASRTASLGLETMTAAALLWGRGPMTTAPLATSSSSSSSSSLSSFMGTDHKPKSNSPASNAAAALLVGMSMRVEHEAKNKLPETEANANQPTALATAASTVSNSPGQTDTALDVESKWREIRLEISKQTLVATQTQSTRGDSEDQEEGLELPKGVTRRPSGAWQAQIYFAGKTRYIGVWEKPQQAATAYNLAKEALKELKAKQRNNRKRRYQYPGNIDTTVGGISNSSSPGSTNATMFTPRKESQSQSPHMPPSISWPSSASSSSTVSSGDFRSPSHGRGPFKKRRGNEMGADGNANEPSVHPPQQASEPGSLPPPRGHPFSAFSQQHLHQQQQQQQQQMLPKGNPHALTHPALQLLSLRPPPQAQHPQWMHLPPPQFHQPQQQQQQFHNLLHSLHQFPYPQPTMGSNNNGTNQNQNHPPMMTQGSTNQNSKVAKKLAKNKLSKLSSKKSKPSSKAAGNNSPSAAKDKAERDAQNLKWKTIRAEVLAIFDESRRKRVFEGGKEDPRKKTFDKDVLRGITVRPSGKFQAQLYFGGRSRYIGVFDSEYEAASAYEMIRSKLKNEPAKVKSERQISSSSTASTASMTSTSTLASVQDSKEEAGKDSKKSTTSASSTSTTMRSITPSPTPRNDGKGEASKILC